MPDIDVQKLLKAVDNANNSVVLNQSRQEIMERKNDILQQLGLKGKTLTEVHKKLKDYRYVDNLDALDFGAFVRWIDIRDPEDVYITNGGLVCDMIPTDDDVTIKCKNMYNRFFQFDFNKSLVFQKLSQQERIILAAMGMLSK